MTDSSQPYRLGSAALPVYLPSLLFATGEGAIIPIIPIDASRLGASLGLAGFIAALLTVGELLGDVPSGWIVARIGERPAMIASAAAALLGLAICLVASVPGVLATGVLLIGLATSSFALARQAFMTSFVPLSHRARALSLLGGMFRGGYFVGPFIAAGVIALTGSTRAVFWVQVAASLVAIAVLLVLPDPAPALAARRAAAPPPASTDRPTAERPAADEVSNAVAEPPRVGLFTAIVQFRGVLARMGLGAALIGGLRSSRQVILPLVAVSLHVPEGQTALIIGIAGAVDFALFFSSGQIMDRFGRLWSALPSMVGLGVGHLALALTHSLPSAVGWFIGIAMFLSVANGLGSGILMTLGADLAPRRDPAPFLGAYRFTGDAGTAAAPLAVAGLTAAFSLPIAAAAMGVVGLGGAALLARWVPRYIPRAVTTAKT